MSATSKLTLADAPATLTVPLLDLKLQYQPLQKEILAAIEKVRVIPPDDFRAPDPENDVNTPV